MTVVGWLAVGVAALLELGLVEPPTAAHPVAWFGRLVGRVESSLNGRMEADGGTAGTGPDERRLVRVGAVAAIVLPAAAALLVGSLVALAGLLDPSLAAVAAGLAVFLTTSLRRLLDAAREVIAASEGATETARDRLPVLVGRDPSDLSPGEVRSAAVESAAENLSDGLIAPLGAFTLGVVGAAVVTDAAGVTIADAAGVTIADAAGVTIADAAGVTIGGVTTGLLTGAETTVPLAVGSGLAAWVKAVNTMDSMWGYPSKPLGTAAARVDDLVMYLPARVTAVALALAAGRPGVLVAARSDAREPASPNAGWPMATVAAVAGVRLRKRGAYELGVDATADEDSAFPSVTDGTRCVRLVRRAGVGSYAVGALCVGVVV